ncbi:hypothetical protein E2C01_010556 [Portunus trituberculatus]|uniref:Uncharacterized protein n=1 Tax=Portunus trituberculatus TaxID=210409 RepID=A0A5B7D8Z8_PORTR|nr:hypothetical protein [Portunus trituberculatus]
MSLIASRSATVSSSSATFSSRFRLRSEMVCSSWPTCAASLSLARAISANSPFLVSRSFWTRCSSCLSWAERSRILAGAGVHREVRWNEKKRQFKTTKWIGNEDESSMMLTYICLLNQRLICNTRYISHLIYLSILP